MDNISNQSLRQKVVSSFLWQGGLSFLSQVVTWVLTIFVIRLLSPSDYGLMAMASIFLEFLVMVSQLGLASAIIQSPRIGDRELQQVLGFIVSINFLACVLAFFFGAPIAAKVFGEPRLILILKVLSINFLIMSFYILPQSLLIRNLEFRKKAGVEFFARITSGLIALILAFMGLGVWALVTAFIALNIFKSVGFNIIYPIIMLPKFSFVGMGRLLRFGTTLTGNQILYFIYSQSDRAISGKIMGKDPLGFYSVALELASIPLDKVAPIIIQISFSAFSRIQSDIARVRQNVLKAVRLASLIFFPMFLGMAVVAPNFIPLVLGQKWAALVVPFQLICLILPLKALDPIVSPAVLGIGKPSVVFWNRAITLAILLPAFIIGAQSGVTGLCLAWLAAYPLVFLFTILRNFRVLGIPFLQLLSAIKFGVVGSTIMALGVITVAHILRDVLNNAMTLVVLISSGILVYLSLVCILNRALIIELRQAFHF